MCLAVQGAAAEAGTTAFDFLRLDNGARETGMGGAAAAAGDAAQGVFYNPALIGGLAQDNRLSFHHSSWLEGITYQNFVYSHRFPDKTNYFGFRYQNLNYGTLSGSDAAGGVTTDYSAGSHLAGLTYGRALPGGVNAGLTLKEAWEKIGDARANALLLDAGFTLRTGWYRAVWGAAIRNIGQKIRFDSAREDAPQALALGLAVSPWGDWLMLSADSELTREHGAGFKFGAEAGYHKLIYVRGGWDSFIDSGAGLRFGVGLALKDISVDYAFLPLSDLGDTHHFTVTWAFGAPQPKKEQPKSGPAPAPAVIVVSTPEVVAAIPEVAASTPEITISTPEVSVSTPEVVLSTPEINISTPEIVLSTMEVVSSTPEVQLSTPEAPAPQSAAAVLQAETRIQDLAAPGSITPGILESVRGAAGDPSCPWDKVGTLCMRLAMDFEYDSAELKGDFRSQIKEIADFLKANSAAVIELQGHTDANGDDAYNMELSEKRAQAVMQYLTGKEGIKKEQITAKGFGKSVPVAANDTDEGRQRNRRVMAVLGWSAPSQNAVPQ